MSTPRPAAHLAFKGGTVVLTARVCRMLDVYAGLSEYRIKHRGEDPELDEALLAIRVVGVEWHSSATGTKPTPPSEPARSSEWITTTKAADLLGVGPRAVVKAIARGFLKAEQVDGRWRIRREDLEHYRANRAKKAA